MVKYRLIYFNLRGKAEVIRLIFAIAHIEYEDYRIDKETWTTMKADVPWGTLPVLEVDGKVIGHGVAIAIYLAAEFGLAGRNDVETAKVEAVVDAVDEVTVALSNFFLELSNNSKSKIKHNLHHEVFPKFFMFLSKIFKGNKKNYAVGHNVTWADLQVYDMLYNIHTVFGTVFKDSKEVNLYYERISHLPRIVEWVKVRPKTAL